jgi:hypothetical protein
MHLENHLGETFEIRIQGNVIDSSGETVDWWFHSSVIITESQKKRKTNLKFLCQEDLNLLFDWLKEIYAGNFEKTLFQFVDGHVWFRIWKKGKDPIVRLFIQGDKYRKFIWDWRLNLDAEKKLLKYSHCLLNTTKYAKNQCNASIPQSLT